MTVAYYGTYSVDEAAKKINAKVEAATWSSRAIEDGADRPVGHGASLAKFSSALR
jgi:hypothetical protein